MSNIDKLTYLIKLFDYADELAGKITPGNDRENNNYFLTLTLIELYFDRVGRLEISRSINASSFEIDDSSDLPTFNKRLDALRHKIRALAQQYDFRDSLERAGRELVESWYKT